MPPVLLLLGSAALASPATPHRVPCPSNSPRPATSSWGLGRWLGKGQEEVSASLYLSENPVCWLLGFDA